MSIPSPKDQVLPTAANLFKSLTLLALLLVSFASAQWIANAVDASSLAPAARFILKWSAVGLLGIANVMLLIGMGILAHDAVHRVLFRSPFWNDLIGGLLSALALLPFYSNRQFHLTHHSYAHQPGLDPENAMHHRSLVGAMTIGSVIALFLQMRILMQNIFKLNQPRYAARVVKDIALLSAAGLFYCVLVPKLGISMAVSILPILIIFPPVFGVRAMSDHYGIPAVQRASQQANDVLEADAESWQAGRERRQRDVSGWVVLTSSWLEWLWSNVNYHEVHHKYPWLSYRHLPAAFEATRDKHNYRVVNGYWRSLWAQRKRAYYDAPTHSATEKLAV
jgi:fatty acid desaturase